MGPVQKNQSTSVYPHVALLALLKRRYRVPYKVSRSQWTNASNGC